MVPANVTEARVRVAISQFPSVTWNVFAYWLSVKFAIGTSPNATAPTEIVHDAATTRPVMFNCALCAWTAPAIKA
ncbi:hypothetical protein D3C81_2024980 [compost metagenome]